MKRAKSSSSSPRPSPSSPSLFDIATKFNEMTQTAFTCHSPHDATCIYQQCEPQRQQRRRRRRQEHTRPMIDASLDDDEEEDECIEIAETDLLRTAYNLNRV
jgi:hypothetical protein